MRSEAWLCEVVAINPEMGIKRRDVHSAIDELARLRLVSVEVQAKNRDPRIEDTRTLTQLPYIKIQYMESAPISKEYINKQIERLLSICRSIEDNKFQAGWRHRYDSWDIDQKIIQLSLHFGYVNQCFYLLNLENAIRGLRDVRASVRKELLQYYRLGFKLMKRDKDYKRVWPAIRPHLLRGDIESQTLDEVVKYSSLKMPMDECVCTHHVRDHHGGKKCDALGCECEQFRLKNISI